MARDQILFDVSLPVAASYASNQYYAVTVNSTGQALLVATAGTGIFGVIQNKPAANQTADVRQLGMTKFTVGSAGAAPGPVMVDATGACVTYVEGQGEVIGWCIETASVTSGNLATVVLIGRGRPAAALVQAPVALTPGATVALNPALGNVFTLAGNGNTAGTINASTVPPAGEMMTIIINGTGTRVTTFGTNFRTTGTVTDVNAKISLLLFMSDGTNFNEIARNVAMT